MSLELLQAGDNLAVYTGIWINRSLGGAYGATITIDREKGGFLIAFLALYVATSGRSFWKLMRFYLHHAFSSKNHPDGVYHQRQAVLRNTQLPEDAAIELLNASIAWRKRAYKGHRRILPSAAAAALLYVAFAIAGIFSSNVTATSLNEVLLSGKDCGPVLNVTGDDVLLNDFRTYKAQKLNNALDYASQCYRRNETSQSDRCEILPRARLRYTVNSNASCPFSDEMCVVDNNNSISLDTGYLDSIDHLGINAAPHFQYRHVRRCAPIVTEGYAKLHIDDQDPSVQFLRYYYGASNDSFLYQWRVNVSRPPLDLSLFRSPESDYQVSTFWGRSFVPDGFKLTPKLMRNDSDVTLIFLDASSIFTNFTITDPWFGSKVPLNLSQTAILSLQADISADIQWYGSDQPAVLGCTTTQIVCNPDLPADKNCMNIQQHWLAGETWVNLTTLWPKKAHHAAIRAAIIPMLGDQSYPDPYYSTPGLGSALLSRSSLFGPVQTDEIQDDRWKIEMEYIFQANLASIQWQLVNAAGGSLFWNYNVEICTIAMPCEKQCKNQKIKSQSYYSFSILGLSIILILGGIIMLTSFYIEELSNGIAKVFSRNSPESTYARLEWKTTTTLQLQRQAHEALGIGTWSKTADSIPVTEKGEMLGVLNVADPKHPRLAQLAPRTISTDSDVELIRLKSNVGHSYLGHKYDQISVTEEDAKGISQRPRTLL
ncbi:hypothetical protein BDV96DRAFT_652889 [Lophiotrema nucula]|uniref:Uncharacterized protein n=1 Tax=Lophiotrema nucula TaxID=690887 RepID=A0A6A5YQB8_9PLEO|nr:hypothetical protein BDV96DRAFT_652889 [Lophiotrema nucula]